MSTPRQQVSKAGLELIERFEGFRAKAARLEDGRWTIGYGHTKTAREGAEISRDDAEALLIYDLLEVTREVREAVYTPLNQNQFDAVVAFAFGIGLDSFRRSAVLRRLNEGQLLQAACAMELWRKAELDGEPTVIDALVRRRSAEKHLFLTPPEGFLAAPSPVLKPRIDYDIAWTLPKETPQEAEVDLTGAVARAARVGAAPAAAPAGQGGQPVTERALETVAARLGSLPAEARAAKVPAGADLDIPPPPSHDAPAHDATVASVSAAAADANRAALDAAAELAAEAKFEREAQELLNGRAHAEPAVASTTEGPPEPAQPAAAAEPNLLFPGLNPAAAQAKAGKAAPARPAPAGMGPAAAAVLGLMGLSIAAGGLYWGVDGVAAASLGALGRPETVGWTLGLVGALCVAVSIWGLLDHLAQREPAGRG